MGNTPRTEVCPGKTTDATSIPADENRVNSLGFQPTIYSRLGEHYVGAIGCLFTVAGQNRHDEIDPNLSLYYDWSNTGKVIMR